MGSNEVRLKDDNWTDDVGSTVEQSGDVGVGEYMGRWRQETGMDIQFEIR